MAKETRLDKVLKTIQSSNEPISGSELAKKYHVSRQVIVQDIALLRAKNIDIVSTHKGYVIANANVQREIHVFHTQDQIEEELNIIVDLGGRIENVSVYHDVYGKLEAQLDVASRRDVKNFMKQLEEKESRPLTELTYGYHSHVISAPNEMILDEIEEALKQANILQKGK